jgi:hypothetical protein
MGRTYAVVQVSAAVKIKTLLQGAGSIAGKFMSDKPTNMPAVSAAASITTSRHPLAYGATRGSFGLTRSTNMKPSMKTATPFCTYR